MLELQWAGLLPLRKPKKKGAGGPDQSAGEPPTGCGLVGPGVSRVRFLILCRRHQPQKAFSSGLLSLFSSFPPSLEFPVQSRSKGNSSLRDWFLTSRPRRECWSLGLLFSALVFFPEPSPRGGGGRLHIWVPESAGMR